MIKQLRKVGNSTALLLDKPLLELLGMTEKDKVQLTVSGGALVITPVQPGTISNEQFDQSVTKVMKKRRKLLDRLAR
jgi:antitoxin component of MazEF toxin-antitoxin module